MACASSSMELVSGGLSYDNVSCGPKWQAALSCLTLVAHLVSLRSGDLHQRVRPQKCKRGKSRGRRYDFTIPKRPRVRFILGMSPPNDIDDLSHVELKSL